jgi:predicted metal-dependent enzyme (double-stranded beta helix superfamily)
MTSCNESMLPAVACFIAALRDLHENELDEALRWAAAADLLTTLLTDPELQEHARGWPTSPAKLGLEGKHANLLFYEDPDYGFVINGLIKKPAAKTTVHDHGQSWTLYGVLDGSESVLRFTRTDGGEPGDLPKRAEVEVSASTQVGKGHVDCIAPWEVHAEYNDDAAPATAVIVRSQKSGTFIQNIFYQKDGSVEQYHGPAQISYHLG